MYARTCMHAYTHTLHFPEPQRIPSRQRTILTANCIHAIYCSLQFCTCCMSSDWDRLSVPVHKPRTWQCYIGAESTGSKQTGQRHTGAESTGSKQTGQRHTGAESTGSKQTRQRHTGAESTGSKQTGQRHTGAESTGRKQTGQRHTGAESTGSKQTGPLYAGAVSTGSKPYGHTHACPLAVMRLKLRAPNIGLTSLSEHSCNKKELWGWHHPALCPSSSWDSCWP